MKGQAQVGNAASGSSPRNRAEQQEPRQHLPSARAPAAARRPDRIASAGGQAPPPRPAQALPIRAARPRACARNKPAGHRLPAPLRMIQTCHEVSDGEGRPPGSSTVAIRQDRVEIDRDAHHERTVSAPRMGIQTRAADSSVDIGRVRKRARGTSPSLRRGGQTRQHLHTRPPAGSRQSTPPCPAPRHETRQRRQARTRAGTSKPLHRFFRSAVMAARPRRNSPPPSSAQASFTADFVTTSWKVLGLARHRPDAHHEHDRGGDPPRRVQLAQASQRHDANPAGVKARGQPEPRRESASAQFVDDPRDLVEDEQIRQLYRGKLPACGNATAPACAVAPSVSMKAQ